MRERMGYYKFHRMSKAEQKAFKANGGKVKLPIFSYITGAFLVVAAMHSFSNSPKDEPAEPWQKADTACLNYVHQQMGGSIFDISTGSNKDAGHNLFKVRVHVEKGDGVISVECLATGDGEVKEVGAFKVRAK